MNSVGFFPVLLESDSESSYLYVYLGGLCLWSTNFSVLIFLLRFLIHSELNFVLGERCGSNFILQCVYSFSAPVLKRLSFSNVCF